MTPPGWVAWLAALVVRIVGAVYVLPRLVVAAVRGRLRKRSDRKDGPS